MTLPRVTILEALKVHFRSVVPAQNGKPIFKVRHERFRDTRTEEMPCVAIRFLGDDAPDVSRALDDPAQLSLAESVMEIRVGLVIDMPIPAESDTETAGDPTDGLDDTGLGEAAKIAEILFGSLWREGQEVETMGGVIWDARYDGTLDDDDLSTPDHVRVVEGLTLVYRTRAEAPHVLLVGE